MELLDLYNEKGDRLGRTAWRSDWRKRDGEYVKVVHVFLMNPEGRILIQQRAFTKQTWPGMWSILGGFVASREEPAQAVIRETAEEYGIDISDCPRRMVGRIVHRLRGAIMEYWMVLSDTPIKAVVCQPEEVECAAYVTWEALLALYASPDRWEPGEGRYRDLVLELIARIPQIFADFSGENSAAGRQL